MGRNIRFYKTILKKCPVQEFLDSLSGKTAQKVTWVLKIIEDLEIVPEKYFKKLDSYDIWECRIVFSGNTYRILGFIHNNSNFILTNGFMKKTRKTPRQEIELALKYKHDYINNGGDKR
jgi:phage-related protein